MSVAEFSGPVRVVTGHVRAVDPTTGEGSGARPCIVAVTFPIDTFTKAPVVQIALSEFDLENTRNSRLEVTVVPESVNKDGFSVRFHTWADTRVWRATAAFIAVGS